jgi:hypothetical protein
MKRFAFVVVALLMFASFAFAAPKTYQATGKVLAMTDASITIEKGKEKWEVARSADTKVSGDLKVGSKVTIYYTMTATMVEVKAETPAKTEKPKGEAKKSG